MQTTLRMAVGLLASLLLVANVQASRRVLERIDVENGNEIHILFNLPLQYLAHTPKQRGDFIRINLKLAGAADNVAVENLAEENLPWSATDTVPLNNVRFRVDATTPNLEIEFNREVEYSVEGGSGFRSIIIKLKGRARRQASKRVDTEPGLTLPASGLGTMKTPDGKPILPGSREERIARLMEEARQAMARGDYSRGVQLYTKVSGMPENPWTRPALEFLGLARERKGQKAQALAVYERFLRQYPRGEAAERVRQRQAGLLTATAAPKKRLRRGGRMRIAKGRGELEFDYFGGWSQFYRRDGILRNTTGHDLTQSALVNDLDLSGRVRKGRYELGTRFSGGYARDFLSNGPGNDNRISAAYMEFLDTGHEHSLRVGRQSHNADGVLGRFDGVLGGYRVNDILRVKGVLGAPVASSSNTGIDYDRYFYGLSADIGQIAEAWDFNLFAIQQIADGVVDRRAVGGEVRYFRPGRSVFTLVDYDLLYNELNTFLMLANVTLEATRTTLNMTLDVRKSPILTTSNAIQGQGVTNLGGLLNTVSTGTARHLAADRTLDSRSLTLGGTQPLSDHYQLSAEMTASYLSGAPASGGVAASNSTGTDFFYSTQLIGSSLFKDGDVTIFGLRFNDVATSNTYTVSLNTRYPVTRAWRVNPRLRFDFRKNVDHTEQLSFRPEFRTTYRIRRRLQLEFEAGGEWIRQELSPRDRAESLSYFVNIGYRMEF